MQIQIFNLSDTLLLLQILTSEVLPKWEAMAASFRHTHTTVSLSRSVLFF